MALARQIFDHDSPSAPVRTGGMLLDTAGVEAPPLLLLGDVAGVSAADGAFSDLQGYGQFDTDSDGNLYICDQGNFAVKKWSYSAGAYSYTDKATALSVFGSGSLHPVLLAIDKTVTPNQIHIGCYDQYVDNTWIGVWAVTSWPTLTTGNRLRSYGSNASSNQAGKALTGIGLTIDATYAVVTSFSSPFRCLRWNHLTGVLQNEATKSVAMARFATDGAGNWWGGTISGTEAGLYPYTISTFTAGTGYDGDTPASQNYRRARTIAAGTAHYGPAYYNGKVYLRGWYTGIQAWDTAGVFKDEYAWCGPLGASNVNLGHAPGIHNQAAAAYNGRHGFVATPGAAYYLNWASNADNIASQSHLVGWPVSIATATWTKTDWSTGTNTLTAILPKGPHLAAEKCRLRLRKNAGAWVTVTWDLLDDADTLASVGTFTSGDTLTLELSLSVWERLDGHASQFSTRDKLPPQNVRVNLYYDDTEATVYVPQQTGAFRGRVGTVGGLRGRIST